MQYSSSSCAINDRSPLVHVSKVPPQLRRCLGRCGTIFQHRSWLLSFSPLLLFPGDEEPHQLTRSNTRTRSTQGTLPPPVVPSPDLHTHVICGWCVHSLGMLAMEGRTMWITTRSRRSGNTQVTSELLPWAGALPTLHPLIPQRAGQRQANVAHRVTSWKAVLFLWHPEEVDGDNTVAREKVKPDLMREARL